MADKKSDPVFRSSGRKGGKTTFKKYGSEHFSRIARKRHRAEKRKRSAVTPK